MTRRRPLAAILTAFALPFMAPAEINRHPGGRTLPHEKYIHVVPETVSPVEKHYIPSADGLYIAAAIRKPKGDGRFPAFIHFHGAPGGRGMAKLITWARGDHGGPVWERMLQEGYAVIVADYRALPFGLLSEALPDGIRTHADDGVAVVEYVKKLPFIDPERVSLYGVSLGGDVVMHTISRTKVRAAILGAPAPLSFMGMARMPAGGTVSPEERAAYFKSAPIKQELVAPRIAGVTAPVLIFAGTKDSLLALDERLHNLLAEAGKPVRLEIYENGYHDFVMGPQGHPGRDEPLMDATLDALELAVRFLKDPK